MKHICWLYISIDQHVHTINHVKDSCGTSKYRHMYESKFCHMCRYTNVPHESLTWFMVWTCWSILIYNQQMCFISFNTNFVIAKKNDPMTSAKKAAQYHTLFDAWLNQRLHNTAYLSELIKKAKDKTWNTIQTLPTSRKNIFYPLAAWLLGHLLTSIFIIKMVFVGMCHN